MSAPLIAGLVAPAPVPSPLFLVAWERRDDHDALEGVVLVRATGESEARALVLQSEEAALREDVVESGRSSRCASVHIVSVDRVVDPTGTGILLERRW